jgi:hypothetical protein
VAKAPTRCKKLDFLLNALKLSAIAEFGLIHTLKVHKRENFLGFDFEICTFS